MKTFKPFVTAVILVRARADTGMNPTRSAIAPRAGMPTVGVLGCGNSQIGGLRMTKLKELEKAIASLSDEEYREFRRWFLERDGEMWDRQIEEDSKVGKLDHLVKEAREAKEGGHLKDL